MTTAASPNEDVSAALLSFLSSTTYPAPELASVELTNSTVTATLSGLEGLLREAENSIRDLSASSKSDIDPWITQARSLSNSVEASKAEAAAIVEDHRTSQSLDAGVRDAQAKVTLLSREVDFIASLTGALDGLAICVGLVDSAASLLADGDVRGAMEKAGEAEKALRGVSDAARVKSILERRVRNVREEGVGVVRGLWSGMVHLFEGGRGVVIKKRVKGTDMSIDDVLEVMDKMGISDAAIERLHRDLDTTIISPRVIPAADGSSPRVHTSDSEIKLSGRSDDGLDVEEMIDDVYKIVNFVKQALPKDVSQQMLDKILPSLILQLVSRWLDPSMPLELDHLERFEQITSKVAALAEFLETTNVDLPSEAHLENWLKRIPQNWLARRKEAGLADLRTNCYAAVRSKEIAERVETQIVSSDDVMYGEVEGATRKPVVSETEEPQQQEDWDSGWNEDEPDQESANGKSVEPTNDDNEVDSSAWDFEDSEATKTEESSRKEEEHQDDDADADAWGWGEDNEETEESSPVESKPTKSAVSAPSKASKSAPAAPKTITLRETYTITHIPKIIISLITSVLDDATTLSSPSFPIKEISSAVPGLSTIPTLILAMYRATANTYYVNEAASNMLIYNDATNLSSSLQSLLSSIPPEHPLRNLQNRLEPDLSTLNSFARRAYGREMAAQRTVLSDILSSASGFVNATLPLNARQYKATVEDAIGHVRSLNVTWTNILSDSARLQSLGGLVGELCRSITSDILERADDPQGISEEQSKVLKGFVDQVTTLQDLFIMPGDQQTEEEQRSLVHVYTPGWFRFIYLGEILEASLADIRYLWTEGELRLEFEANEVVDLIQALFADSVHRRDAIRAIKRTNE